MKAADRVLQIAQEKGVVRPRDLVPYGLSPTHLQRLYEQGLLVRSGRGIYFLPEAEQEERLSLAQVVRRVPTGVVCLVSALEFHGLTTQIPHAVWLALSPRTPRHPRGGWPPLEVVQMTGDSLTEGIETHTILQTPVRVFSPAKTVADCFKFRGRLGTDVALEALRDAWRKKRVTMDELIHYGEICRVARVMRPYLESLI